MQNLLFEQLSLYAAAILVLFVPGYFFVSAFFPKNKNLSGLEKFTLSVGSSFVLVGFVMMALDRVGVRIDRLSLILSLVFLSAAFFGVRFLFKKHKGVAPARSDAFVFSKKQLVLIIGLLFVSMLFKTSYLKDNIVPSSTDLGHHMYWVKQIAQTGELPDYAKKDIVERDGKYIVSGPQNISDLIIGEHMVFAAISIISGLGVISYFPVLILLLMNSVGVLAIFILVLRFFEDDSHGKDIAIASLLFIGPLFAIAPPQAKFVGGGVVGNMLSNLLIPLNFYFYFRALKEKSAGLLAFGIMFSMALFYTHHLSALLFAIILIFSAASALLLHFGKSHLILWDWAKLVFSKPVLIFLAFAAFFFFAVHTPSYITNKAVETVVGGPSKIDHVGLTLDKFISAVGEPRFVLGSVGFLLLLAPFAGKFFASISGALRKKSFSALFAGTGKSEVGYQNAILLSWTVIIFLISLYPTIFLLDIPSSRVSNYGSYPLSILAAIALVRIVVSLKNGNFFTLNKQLAAGGFILFFSYATIAGFRDNSQFVTSSDNYAKTVQTFHASEYLARNTAPSDNVLSDHVYVAADSWSKLYFMRDYNFPFYRANFSRYQNGVDKEEFCTLNMISSPETEGSDRCFDELGMDYVMVSKKNDSSQFSDLDDFWQIYSNEELIIYHKAK
ncbi:MAG: hypothetical protein UX75_C0015G0026 [Candidatus Moranbacteria bacterium GW2011_GWE2_47_10]|nr:MAG: hypothetical protein UX75_C0015G0026 [Candidatus Moranbacteria bacterium GW2011_GWE2_47_10]